MLNMYRIEKEEDWEEIRQWDRERKPIPDRVAVIYEKEVWKLSENRALYYPVFWWEKSEDEYREELEEPMSDRDLGCEIEIKPSGKYGGLWKQYMQAEHPDMVPNLSRNLVASWDIEDRDRFLRKAGEVEEQATEMMYDLMKNDVRKLDAWYRENHPSNPLEYARRYNQIKYAAEEIVMAEVVNRVYTYGRRPVYQKEK